MDIDQGDTNSPNPCSTGFRDMYVLYYVSISTHPASGDYQVPGTPTMPLLGASYTDAIPANARSSETGYPLNQYGSFRRSSREKEKTVSDQWLSVNWKTIFFGSAVASSSAEEPKAKKQKINKKDSEGRSILVRAFARRGEESHVAEAEITLDSDGAFAVDYVAAKLLLKGTFYVSDILFGRHWQ